MRKETVEMGVAERNGAVGKKITYRNRRERVRTKRNGTVKINRTQEGENVISMGADKLTV